MTNDRQEPNAEVKGVRPDGGPPPTTLRWDYVVGAVVIVFCAVVYYITTTFDEVPEALSHGVPPTQFPRLILGIMVFLSGLMMYQASHREPKVRKPVPRMVYLSAGLLVLFVVGINTIGTIIPMVLFCVALAVLWGERRYWILAIYAIVFPIAVYFLFTKLLEVRFPRGFLELMLG